MVVTRTAFESHHYNIITGIPSLFLFGLVSIIPKTQTIVLYPMDSGLLVGQLLW